MSDKDKRESIFTKGREVIHNYFDDKLSKSRNSVVANQNYDDDFTYSKAITEDPSQSIHSAGWKEKPHRLQNGHLKQIAYKNSIVASIIQTRQNQVGNFSKYVESENEKGWTLVLRNREELLEKIKEKLSLEREKDMQKSAGDGVVDDKTIEDSESAKDYATDDDVEEFDWELHRKAEEILENEFKKAKAETSRFIKDCGIADNRSFESKKWTIDKALRALVRDRLTYALSACEIVKSKDGRPHHWFPIDSSTVKFASNKLASYKETAENFLNLDILYPERQAKKIEDSKVLELEQDLVDKGAYKWVQVIRGKIERAYTEDELKVLISNPSTDIYNNGYGISELELAVSLITGHLNAEFYNQAYFTQGFSAKGILHIKAPINRRKMESVRQNWQHMLKGARNSFQTPIFAGVEGIEWIPLTQNHNDIGFEGWMRYLLKMICAIYQIDPQEVISLKDEGGSGINGDNTKEKLDQSKDKGLYPLLREIESFISENILKPYDDRFEFKFCGANAETTKEKVERLEKESKFAKTVNEVRKELGLKPLPGCDDLILNADYLNQYNQYSTKAKELMEDNEIDQTLAQARNEEKEQELMDQEIEKSIKIETYKLEE